MTKKKELIWVYPPNNWVSNFNKTFVYGWCNPKTKLFVSVVGADRCVCPGRKQGKHIGLPIQIFPNGNFAQTIKLPHKKNVIKLIQTLNGKRNIISRYVNVKHVGVDHCVYPDIKQGKHIDLPVQKKNIVIVVDPGHGGKEHGTHSPKGIPEKHFNLQIAKLLFKNLRRGLPRQTHNWKIYLTRSKDKYVSLKDRVEFAKKKKCNLFISIHHNALPDNEDPLKHKGTGIYYTHDFVKPFAKKLLESISNEGTYCNTPLKKYGIFKRDFAVTRPDFYHGVLIECGFLIHPTESELITKKKTQEKIVRGIISTLLKRWRYVIFYHDQIANCYVQVIEPFV